PGQSHLSQQIVKPILKSYANTYGQGPGHFWDVFKQHPLQPILDVGTALSLGAGAPAKLGSLAVRVGGEGSALANAGTRLAQFNPRYGRLPVDIPPDVAASRTGQFEGISMPRDYSASPLRRLLIQRPLDKAIGSGRLGR